jgi:GAF domain
MKAYSIQLPYFQLHAHSEEQFDSKMALKKYVWSHFKDEIFERLIIDFDGGSVEKDEVADAGKDEPQMEALQQTIGDVAPPNDISLAKKLELLNTIARVQRQFFHSESPKIIFGCMLDALLHLTDSEYGFIGEIKYEDDGTKYLQTHAITNIAWDQVTRQFYDDNINQGLKFTNMNTLFGTVITTKEVVISNTPLTDKRAGGIPKGHPPLNHFLGIPFFMPGGEMNGMVGISNKPGGYTNEDIEFLEVSGIPLTPLGL